MNKKVKDRKNTVTVNINEDLSFGSLPIAWSHRNVWAKPERVRKAKDKVDIWRIK